MYALGNLTPYKVRKNDQLPVPEYSMSKNTWAYVDFEEWLAEALTRYSLGKSSLDEADVMTIGMDA